MPRVAVPYPELEKTLAIKLRLMPKQIWRELRRQEEIDASRRGSGERFDPYKALAEYLTEQFKMAKHVVTREETRQDHLWKEGTGMSSIDDGELYLACPGSTEEQLTEAITAARKAFEDAGVKPEDGFVARFSLEGIAIDGGQPSKKDLSDAQALNRAEAAAKAVCGSGQDAEAPNLGLWENVRHRLQGGQYGRHYHLERT